MSRPDGSVVKVNEKNPSGFLPPLLHTMERQHTTQVAQILNCHEPCGVCVCVCVCVCV